MNYASNPKEHVAAAFRITKELISVKALRRKQEEKEKRKAQANADNRDKRKARTCKQ